jgi:hypothetical protein
MNPFPRDLIVGYSVINVHWLVGLFILLNAVAFVISQRDCNATPTTSGLCPISRQSCPIKAKSNVDRYFPELRARLEM